MPRLRISVFSNGLRKPDSSMAWKFGNHRARCVDLVTQRRHERSVRGDIDLHAGAEADEAEALAARKNVAFANIAEYAPRDESGNLYAGDIGAPGGAQPERVALVLQRRLVERGVQEAPGIVPALLHLAVHGRPVGVRIEDVHEYADLDRVALKVWVTGPLHRYDASVGRGDNRVRIPRSLPRRVAKKLQHEKHREPERRRPPAPEPARRRSHEDRNGEKGPAFTGDDRVRVARAHCWLAWPLLQRLWREDQFLLVSTSLFFLIQGIIALNFSPTTSIGCSAVMRWRESRVGAPARFSRINSFAYSPDWMRASAERIAFLVSSVMIFGPVAYSPYSALFEIE